MTFSDFTKHPPLIGLNMSLVRPENEDSGESSVSIEYIDAVESAGGVPVCLPTYENIGAVRAIVPFLAGFLFIGGRDYLPHNYGGHPQPEHELMDERRDRFDTALARIILHETKLPVLGICGGQQLLAIACGGSLIQDIRTKWVQPQDMQPVFHAKNERHGPEAAFFLHKLTVREGSLLERAVGGAPATGLYVNSFHHQAVRPDRVGEGLCASAWSADGIIEAVEPAPDSAWFLAGRFVLGVQWHPERMKDNEHQRQLFCSLIEAAKGRRL